MINSYFQSSVNRPSFPRNHQTSKTYIAKNIIQAQYNRYKLFIIIIAKATARVIKSSFQIIHQNTKIIPQTINKITALTDRNINLTVFLAFQKLKVVAGYKKKDDKAIKNIVILLQRMEKYKIKQVFSRIVLYCFRLDKKFIETFHSQRTFQFTRKLALILKHKKKSSFETMVNWSNFIKSFSKLRVILVIRNRLQRQAKQNFLIRLNRLMLKKSQKDISSKQIIELKTQLEDMNVQLQNKNENIQRLQTQISQYKIQQSNLSYNNISYGQYNNNNRSKQYTKAHSLKKMSFNQKSIAKMSRNQSHDNFSINDISIGSILGNLNKSRTDSASKFQQSYDCSCGFKPKYKKYRNLYDSLKNQLQIVKEQLEVAKDLNEHFTNQIKQYLSGESNQGDYQKLKRQHSLLQQERDQLREKVFKYQKHINNLKAEFKVKMQQLYRKVRKDM